MLIIFVWNSILFMRKQTKGFSKSSCCTKKKEEEFRETIHSLIKEEDIMTLAEQYPQGSWLLEELLLGKSLEERDMERDAKLKEEQIIYFFNLGLEIDKIVLFSKSDKKHVEQVIANFQKNKK